MAGRDVKERTGTRHGRRPFQDYVRRGDDKNDNARLLQTFDIYGVQHHPTPAGNDLLTSPRNLFDCLYLKLAEGNLPVLMEDIRNGLTRQLFYDGIRLNQASTEPSREHSAHSRLARPHEAYQRDITSHAATPSRRRPHYVHRCFLPVNFS